MRIQAALEYLSNYIWAIVIILIVLAALYALGAFNSSTFQPKLQPGGCFVERPNGPGTGQFLALQGTCTNEVPEFVAKFSGQNSYISTPQINQEAGTNPISFTVWFKVVSLPGSYPMVFGDTLGSGPRNGYDVFVSPSTKDVYLERWSAGTANAVNSNPISLNTWYFLAGTYNGITLSLYINGNLVYSASATGTITPDSAMSLGAESSYYNFGNYQIADFQIFNTTLSANNIKALYLEGIGGVPISLQNLVGWWPLNGNPNDYSGNLNNGAPTNALYTGSWSGGYTVP